MRLKPVYLVARDEEPAPVRPIEAPRPMTRRAMMFGGLCGVGIGYLAGFAVHGIAKDASAKARPDVEDARPGVKESLDWARGLAVGPESRLVENAAGFITVANQFGSGTEDLVIASGLERLALAAPDIGDPGYRAVVSQSVLSLVDRGWFQSLPLEPATVSALHSALRIHPTNSAQPKPEPMPEPEPEPELEQKPKAKGK